jgi:hypothetical protein
MLLQAGASPLPTRADGNVAKSTPLDAWRKAARTMEHVDERIGAALESAQKAIEDRKRFGGQAAALRALGYRNSHLEVARQGGARASADALPFDGTFSASPTLPSGAKRSR